MPTGALRYCAAVNCPALVRSGYCPAHQRPLERRRGSAHARGYTAYWHAIFRPAFIARLVAAGIPPICGAALPGGPQTAHSRCQAAGLVTGTELHLHHEPPLTAEERQQRARVCDPFRIQLLCASCHRAIGRTIEHVVSSSTLSSSADTRDLP
jgi:hypothetical protein